MKVEIQSVHFEASKALERNITKKLEAHFGPYPYITRVIVFLREVTDKGNPMQQAEAEVHLTGTVLFAKDVSEKFEKSVENVVQKLKRQLEKYKAKTYRH